MEKVDGAVEEAEELEVEAGRGYNSSNESLDEGPGEEGVDGGDVGELLKIRR